ncbi:MAG: ribosome small subunit-dependent GTPase A [bacterium]|nr:ribosome small subunit-dependent GTPase A [bacterium]
MNQNDQAGKNKFMKGKVLEGYGSSYSVLIRTKTYNCMLRGRFRLELKDSYNPIAVGDRVKISKVGDTDGVIEELLPRDNKISRPTKSGVKRERIIAANIDKLVAVVSTIKPDLKPGLIDRLLLVAERESVKGAICINKWDLAEKGEFDNIVKIYKDLGYEVFTTDALSGDGVEDLENALKDRFTVFIGQSGVGKTTLLNKIIPGLNRKTQEVSDYSDKGKHTTSYVSAVALESGGMIADTPGFRNFGIWGVEREEIAGLYREFRKFEDGCKYSPCTHYHEPHCAVKDALEDGKISELRYENYRRIYESFDEEFPDKMEYK